MTDPSAIVVPDGPDPRADLPWSADEITMLSAWLDFHRETLRVKCAGLTGDQLVQQAATPSTLSLLGLVRHMAEVERSWFRRTLAGEDAPRLYSTGDARDGDFLALDPTQAVDAFATWDREVAAARAITARYESLDSIGALKRHDLHDVSLRWILVHMIEEYARHNGHADLIREAVDGRTGE